MKERIFEVAAFKKEMKAGSLSKSAGYGHPVKDGIIIEMVIIRQNNFRKTLKTMPMDGVIWFEPSVY